MVSGGGGARLWRAGAGVAAVLLVGMSLPGVFRGDPVPAGPANGRTVTVRASTLAGEAVRSAAPRARPKYGAHKSAATPRPNVLVVRWTTCAGTRCSTCPTSGATARPRAAVRELVLAVPAVLPGAQSFLLRAVHPQPPRLHHHAPYGFAAFHDSHTIATSCSGRATRRPWSASTSTGTARALRVTGRSSLRYMPAGVGPVDGGSDHIWLRRPAVPGQHLQLLLVHPEHQRRHRPFPGQYSST